MKVVFLLQKKSEKTMSRILKQSSKKLCASRILSQSFFEKPSLTPTSSAIPSLKARRSGFCQMDQVTSSLHSTLPNLNDQRVKVDPL